MLSFDDGYVDFLEAALPLLHRYGFPATLFVPTGRVGTGASWDSRHGEPASLLGWDDLRLLRHCDVSLGSHGVSHIPLPALSAVEQWRELAASRTELSVRCETEIDAIAYPFGVHSLALGDGARRCGYRIGMTCDYGWVGPDSDPLLLPRVEVTGDSGVAGLASLLGIS